MNEPEQIPLFEVAPPPQHHGVQILLKRMETHPQEFSLVEGPWSLILAAIVYDNDKDISFALDADEKQAIIDKFKHLSAENFSSAVLHILTSTDK